MGTIEGKQRAGRHQEPKKDFRSCMACLVAFVVSMVGGVIMGFWEYRYHATNSQLWMVPFGLILLITPVMVWLALVVSESCNNSKDDIESPGTSQS